MAIKMLMFDFREEEKNFFKTNPIEDFDIKFIEESLNKKTLQTLSEDDKLQTTVISVFINSTITKEIIDSFPNLMIIATRSTGFNHIDLDECKKQNIKVLNVENYGKTGVMQFTFGLILSSVRKIYTAISDLKSLKKDDAKYVGRDLNNLTLGVIGTGTIGSGVCMMANAFGMKILAYDIRKKNGLIENYRVEYVSKTDILKKSDIITLHTPYNSSSYHMISKKEFDLMKPTSYLINVSRGELIDTKALYDALKENKLAGCALDVIECENSGVFCENKKNRNATECVIDCEETNSIIKEILKMPNVLITPHIAYKTQDSIDYILKTTMISIKNNLKGEHTNKIN